MSAAAGRAFVAHGRGLLVQVTALAAIVGAWQLASLAAGVHILPGPLETVPVFVNLVRSGRFVVPLAGSLSRALTGFTLAFLLGVTYGIIAGRSRRFEHVSALVFQVALFFNTLVLILWGLAIMGNANYWAVVAVTALAVFPNVGVYTRGVIKTIDRDMLEMAEAYHASPRSRILDVYLPFLAPAILASARIAFSMSWKVVMLAEVFGFPSGIGWQIAQAYQGYNLAGLISWLVVFVITLLLAEQLLRVVERRAIRWR